MSSESRLPLPDYRSLAQALAAEERCAVGGVVPAARALVLVGLENAGSLPPRTTVLVPSVVAARELVAALEVLAPQLQPRALPPELATPYTGTVPPAAAVAELVELARALDGGCRVVVAAARSLLLPLPDLGPLATRHLELVRGQAIDLDETLKTLVGLGFRRRDLVEEPGEMAARGGVLDLHPGGEEPFRLELDWGEVGAIHRFDPASQRRIGEPQERLEVGVVDPYALDEDARLELMLATEAGVELSAALEGNLQRSDWWAAVGLKGGFSLPEQDWPVLLCDPEEVEGELIRVRRLFEKEYETGRERGHLFVSPELLLSQTSTLDRWLDSAWLRVDRLQIERGKDLRWFRTGTSPIESFARRLPELVPTLRQRRAEGAAQILVVADEAEKLRFTELLRAGELPTAEHPPVAEEISITTGQLEHGFVWGKGLAVYGRRELSAAPRRARRKTFGEVVSDLRDLKVNDLVVHIDHGIGRFLGFVKVEVLGSEHEMLKLGYDRGDSLMVPVERADLVQKYASGESVSAPSLDRLGSTAWTKRKSRVKKAVREMAAELLRLAAMRASVERPAYSPDSPWQKEFEAAFPFELTADQDMAVRDIKADLESEKPMDRLLVGDVGFGKTEVAIRSSFKAVLDGRQVAVLVPTTILAEQHWLTFGRRMEDFPVEIRMLSRFVSDTDATAVLEGLEAGDVDIVVGTHRLLSDKVKFADLGLLILDEEQRFGVAQKERLKQLRAEVDVLALSATPIPRTLNMALSGLRDISVISSPPRDRMAVQTAVVENSDEVIREAVLYELEREGQVFFVHNRVESIGAVHRWLADVVPEAKIVVAHGQMSAKQLETSMHAFIEGEANVLLATAIIENGLDIPNANTLIVHHAERFGLAQLYQLRGRVGRSDRLAFAWFLVPPGRTLSETARQRLGAIQEFCDLGAGFRIAARDLEIRGAGNLLGGEQHGFLEAVGFDTYCQLLEEAVAELDGKPMRHAREVELKLGLELQLPESWIPEPPLRLSAYKRIAAAKVTDDLVDVRAELVDRYGRAPAPLDNLLMAQRLRLHAARIGLSEIRYVGKAWKLSIDTRGEPSAGLIVAVQGWPGAQLDPSGRLTLPHRGEDHHADLEQMLAGC